MTIKLSISAKGLDPKVTYNPFITEQTFIQTEWKEVIKRNPLNRVGIFASTLGLSVIPNIASAATGDPTMVSEIQISPEMIFQYALKIALIGLGVSFGAAMVLLIINGILKMALPKQREKQKAWTTDIYKGFVHCLVTIPTIFALYYLATNLFSQFNISNDIFFQLH